MYNVHDNLFLYNIKVIYPRYLIQFGLIIWYLWLLWMFSTLCCCCLVFWDPVDCSLPGSSAHGISQEKILEWVAISFSRGSFQPRGHTRVCCIGRWVLNHRATWRALTVFYPVHVMCPKFLTSIKLDIYFFNTEKKGKFSHLQLVW